MAMDQLSAERKSWIYSVILYPAMKRTFDILLSLILIMICVPIGCVIYWKLRNREGNPAFIKQLRSGKNGKPFMHWRFRTHSNTSNVIHAFPPQPFLSEWSDGVPNRVNFTSEMTGFLTPTGRFLWKYHLHHIPELFHVLTGNMSLVGPRPELIEVAAYYNENQRLRLLDKPGITCFAQLNNHTSATHHNMITDDLRYIENQSLWLDMKIIWYTLIRYPNRYIRNKS